MAGVFPVPVKTTGRKQWTIYNGGKGIKRLGSPLMDDWCPDSQVVLAKKLLDEKCDLDVDQEENARLGVYWLIKASEQGHEEATQLLSHCLETGQGICEQNYVDVRACLDMPQEEKLARCAARKVFEGMSAGEDFITSSQLQDRMLHLDEQKELRDDEQPSTSKNEENADWKSRSEGGEKLTEDMLISAASTYARGELPLVTAVLSLQPSRSVSGPCSALHAVLLHPFTVAVASYNHIVKALGTHSIGWYMPMSWSQVKLVLAVLLFLHLGLDTAIAALPSVLYYGSLTVMVVATCQVLTKRHDMHHFRRWSSLFLAYSEGNVNAGQAEYQYCRNNLRPYIWFFLGLLAHLLLYPMLRQTIPQSELSVLAFIFTCLTLYNFTLTGRRSPDWLGLFSFAVHVLAKYPYETDAVVSQGWRFLDVHVPTFASYVVGNGVEFCLNFRALFYLVIPAVLVKMAARDNWRGCYTALVPHCLALSWWQIALTASEGATWYGLIRSALALAGLVLFLPLAGLATVLLPLAAASKVLVESHELLRLKTASFLALVPLLLSLYVGRLKILYTRAATFFSWLQVMLSAIAVVLLVWPALQGEDGGEAGSIASSLSWDQFQTFCPNVDVETQTALNAHLQCSQLVGAPVNWEGRVVGVRLVRVSNPLAHVISRLPLGMRSGLTCLLGLPYHACEEDQYCSLPSGLIDKCHLANWDRYELEVDISMSTAALWRRGDSQVTLVADHTFLNFTRALSPGDRLWFSGLLSGDDSGLLSRTHPQVTLIQLGCLSCHDSSLSTTSKTHLLAFSLRDVYSGLKTVLNFLFNPLVIFR
ncbi:wolframin [Macrosteles quadrilineatus]|uniref:wolframin n=1 Tax=Macrosteles quadrilineatus TaxID=74068 RepID=UPI0023E296C4|nr:wolframin [Macrosteles quadrilineatus]